MSLDQNDFKELKEQIELRSEFQSLELATENSQEPNTILVHGAVTVTLYPLVDYNICWVER